MAGKRCKTRERLRKHWHLLNVLRSADPTLRKRILAGAQRDLITSLAECSRNVVTGNQPLTPRCKRVLSRHKTALRRLSEPHHRVPWQTKRRLLVQRGGFLPIILSALISGLLSKVIGG